MDFITLLLPISSLSSTRHVKASVNPLLPLSYAQIKRSKNATRTRQELLSSQAYTLFSEGKSPVQVAIELNIRASEAIIFQREYWELEGLHNLNQIYQEIKDGTWNFVNLWKSVKAAGMGVPHVNRLLTIANNNLPSVELRYEGLKKEAATLEYEKANSAREFSTSKQSDNNDAQNTGLYPSRVRK